ncbi:MAG: ATP-binding protein [Polyangiaceae bacterium]|nr:ATP-binding protein [Polyangiaceae bacterium]
MKTCECKEPHERRRVVLTGGPGAGKTAVLELIRQSFCMHMKVLPEAAGIVFGGGFPREEGPGVRRAAQRAIFFIQRELEAVADASDAAIVLCDRGTVDGAAYWPGPGDFWSEVGTSLEEQLGRYDAIIHLRTPALIHGYNRENPLRIESPMEAAAIDGRIAAAWAPHPRRFFVDAATDFLIKARRALAILREEMPECCRQHVVPSLDLAFGSSEEPPDRR